jgi:hypothetical protein
MMIRLIGRNADFWSTSSGSVSFSSMVESLESRSYNHSRGAPQMKVIDVSDWKTFEQTVQELRDEYDKDSSPLLFRGQGNSEWDLATTLDRNTYWTVTDTPNKNVMYGMTLLDYYDLITGGVGPEVKTFSGVDVPDREQKVADSFFQRDLLYRFPSVFPDMQLYRYMAYLVTSHFRHLCSTGRDPLSWQPSSPFARIHPRESRRERSTLFARVPQVAREACSDSRRSIHSDLTFKLTTGISVSAATTPTVLPLM